MTSPADYSPPTVPAPLKEGSSRCELRPAAAAESEALAETAEAEPTEATPTEATPTEAERSTGRRSAKSFIQTVGFAFAIVGLQMGQGILLARLLGPEGRGQYATAVLYVQLLLYVGLFGGLEVICRHAADGGIERTRLRRAALRLGVATGIVTTLVVILCDTFALPEGKRFLMPLGWLCACSVVGQQVMLIMTGVDRGSGSYTAYNIRRFVAAAAFPVLLLSAAMISTVDLVTACWLFVLASFVSMAACVIGVPKPFRGPSEPSVGRLLRDSRPYGVSMLATDLFERLDLLLVLWLTPLVTQGYYAAMVPVVYPLTVIPNTLGIFLFNAGANADRHLKRDEFRRILSGALAVQAVSCLAFVLLIGPLVRFVYGDEFGPAVVFAIWLAPVSALKGVLQGLDSYVKGRGRPLASVRCRLVAAIAMLVVTAVGIGPLGAIAIAIAALVGQVICLIWLTWIVLVDIRQTDSPS